MAGKPKVPYATLVEAFLKSKSATAVAIAHGVTEQTVFAALNRHGLRAIDFKYNNPPDQEIVSAYAELGSGTEVAKLLHTSDKRVYAVLRSAGIDPVEGRKKRLRVIPLNCEAQVMRDYEHGRSLAAIAADFGCSATAVLDLLKRTGVHTRPRKLDLPKAEIKQLYESGLAYTQIAQKYHCSYTTIMKLIRSEFPEIARPNGAGPDSPGWRGGRWVDKEGYVQVWIDRNDPFACMGVANGKGREKGTLYVPEHRLVMARHLGRPLRDDETVNHIRAKEKTNNALDNLQLRHGNHGKHGPMICADCGSSNLIYIPIADAPGAAE